MDDSMRAMDTFSLQMMNGEITWWKISFQIVESDFSTETVLKDHFLHHMFNACYQDADACWF